MTGHYKLGFHILPVYVNIEQIFRFLEGKYNFDVNRMPARCFTWPHAYNTYDSSMSGERQSLLKTLVRLYSQVCNEKEAWSQSFFPVTYRSEDGRGSKKLTEGESKNTDIIMSGRLISGANIVEIFYNMNAALYFLEGSMGLKIPQ